MTDALFLLPADDWGSAQVGSELTLDGPEGRHAATVMRITPGQSVIVGDGAGRRARVDVTHSARDVVVGTITALILDPPPMQTFTLVQALAKGGRDEQAIEMATEFGVDVIVPWQAPRSVVQWRGERAEKGILKWRAVVTAATKQSRRVRMPRVAPLASTADVFALAGSAPLALLLHEDADRALADLVADRVAPDTDVVIIVGPEGGIGAEDEERFVLAGAIPVHLGANVLRSSSAGPAALAVLNASHRWRHRPTVEP